MELIEQIQSYLAWIDNDDATSEDMPSWMEDSEWADFEDGSSEAWEYVLLRRAKDEIEGLLRAIRCMANSKDGQTIAYSLLYNCGIDTAIEQAKA